MARLKPLIPGKPMTVAWSLDAIFAINQFMRHNLKLSRNAAINKMAIDALASLKGPFTNELP